MIRVADYIANFISEELKVDTVFMVSGGGMMFLSDGLALNDDIQVVCNHHEQASAMAAVGYGKRKNDYACAYFTTGCGGTNAVTGLLNAYQDSIPCFFISGQVKLKETSHNAPMPLRQFGVQEANIIAVVEPLTKYAEMVDDPCKVAYYLEKAAYLAKSGRPGPVWLDVPLDVQGALVEESELIHFSPEEKPRAEVADADLAYVAQALALAKRPILVAGHGIRLSKSIESFKALIERIRIPYVASRLGIDLLPSDHPLFIGRIGTKGDRAGNFAVQNADLILTIGSRLSVSSTGHQYELFGRKAEIIVVDIDVEEHQKGTVRIDRFIQADASEFMERFLALDERFVTLSDWVELCRRWKYRWPVCLPEYVRDEKGINLYYFTDRLSQVAPDDATVVSDAGSAFYVVSQGYKFRGQQRYVTTGAQAEMGYTLPAAIGAAMASPGSDILAVTGDGSLQMNIQELQTLVHYQWPVKLFVWNNNGYLSIRATQRKFFDARYIGTDADSGVSFPELKKICKAYGLPFMRASRAGELDGVLHDALKHEGPVVVEIMADPDQEIVPSVASVRKEDGTMVSRPLEDMYPFLSREEFYEEMVVDPVDESLV